MSTSFTKRSGMTLFSGSDPYSHRVRIVLAEKNLPVDILDISENRQAKEELAQLNPYGTVPMLIDRELAVFQSDIIMEYLDERFPHPSLLPVYPVARARTRLMIYRINRDWYTLMDKMLALEKGKHSSELTKIRKELKEGLTSINPILKEMPFFLSEEFSVIDCCMAPLLWRLPQLGVELPIEAQSVIDYAERLFSRDSFLASLTYPEREIRR